MEKRIVNILSITVLLSLLLAPVSSIGVRGSAYAQPSDTSTQYSPDNDNGLRIDSSSTEPVVVFEGFSVTLIASGLSPIGTGANYPNSLQDLEPGQGSFGNYLYFIDDGIVHRTATPGGQPQPFAYVPAALVMRFGFDGDLFVGTASGQVIRVLSDGTTSQFAQVGTSIEGIAFDTSSTYGARLFVSEWIDGGHGRVSAIDASGLVQVFVSPGNVGIATTGLEFCGPTPRLYAVDQPGTIFEISNTGSVSLLGGVDLQTQIQHAETLACSHGDTSFGNYLYLAEQGYQPAGRILRVSPDGAIEVFASGFQGFDWWGVTGLKFSPDGKALYVTDDVGRSIYAIESREAAPAPAPFLDLPIAYDSFAQAAQGNVDGQGPGRVNSWFDHTYPDYDSPNHLTRWDGTFFDLLASAAQQGVSWYGGHDGLDFSHNRRQQDEQIFAAAPGAVFKTVTGCEEGDRWCGNRLGNQVWIDHGNGYATVYAHLKTVHVAEETRISEPMSQPLGTMGNTGNSDGTHLHFAVYYDHNGDGQFEQSEVVDPYGWSGAGPDPWGIPSHYLWKHPLWINTTAGPSGTSVSSPSGSVNVSIPADSLTTTVTLELWDTTPVAPTPAQLRSTGLAFWLRVFDWLPDGQIAVNEMTVSDIVTDGFAEPVTLTVSYALTDVLYLDQDQLTVYRWDDGSGAWDGLPTAVDKDRRQVVAQTLKMGSFDLKAPLLCPADDREPDNTYASAGPISADGIAVSRLLVVAEDEDWFRLETVAGAAYTLQTQHLADEVETVLSIYDLDGLTLLASDDSSGGGNGVRLVWRAPKTGVYFARVTPAPGSVYGCTAAYEMVISVEYQTYLPVILGGR